MTKVEHKYIEVAQRIEELIANGILNAGDKLLSVRALSKEQGISMSTAFQAYYWLESKGLIEARPQSGYYVTSILKQGINIPTTSEPPEEAFPVSVDEMISQVYKNLRAKELINFSMAAARYTLLPIAKLNKSITNALRQSPSGCTHYEGAQGNELLRKQIARQAFNWGGRIQEDDIIITAGCVEALSLCIKAITQKGDTVAIESPTFYAIYQVLESHGLRVVEIPTDPTVGVDLDYLETAIPKFDIKACLFVHNFNNPIGSCMPDGNKKRLVDMLAKREIPLIEDDIYGELYFGKTRPRTCKSYDKKGLVLHCGSFSKSLSPGYRVGWAIPGKFKDKVLQLKRMHSISTNTLTQAAIADKSWSIRITPSSFT
jgi:DNA-binding transcriptional MocR family regulator